MGIRVRSTEPRSILGTLARNNLISLPPNRFDWYAATVGASGNWDAATPASPFDFTLLRRTAGVATDVWGIITDASGDWDPGDSVTIRVTGKSETFKDLVSEFTITEGVAFGAGATGDQIGATPDLFKRVDQVQVIGTTGTVTTESLAIGVGTGLSGAAPGGGNLQALARGIYMESPFMNCGAGDALFYIIAHALTDNTTTLPGSVQGFEVGVTASRLNGRAIEVRYGAFFMNAPLATMAILRDDDYQHL